MANQLKYWWECESCGAKPSFPDTVEMQIGAFIWDRVRKDWDQGLLVRECSKCKERSLRIAYDFPQHGLVFRVKHIVGVQDIESYVPMMWEFYEIRNPSLSKYQFNYLTGRNPMGLKTAAIVSAEELKRLFMLYCEKTGRSTFP